MSDKVNILGVKVDKVNIDQASDKIIEFIKNGEKGTVTIFKSADNTVRVVLLIAIPSAILLAGIVLSVLILVKKKR